MTRTRYTLSDAVMAQVNTTLATRQRRAFDDDDAFEEDDAGVETAADGDVLEILISGRIGASFWYGGVSAAMVAEAMAGHTGALRLRINSPGGDAFEGFAIYNLLSVHPGQITVRVEGLAASAASIIAMVGDTIEMAPASMVMIHDAWSIAIGNADDMRAEADVVDSISQISAEIYADKAGGTADAWRGKMRAESWYAPGEAVAAGLADVALAARHGNAVPPSEQDLEERAARGEFRYAGRAKAPAPVINRAAVRPVVTAASVGGRAGALVSRGALAYRAQPALLQRAMVSLESEIKGNVFEGYAAVFGQVSDKTGEDWREQFAEGSFDDVIAERLTAALWNHNPDHLLGRQSSGTLRLSADSGGLSYALDIPNTSVGRDLRELHERGDITGASVGFLPGLDAWGLTDQGDRLRTHTQVSYLRDISPVSFAAYDGTSVDMRSTAGVLSSRPSGRGDQLVRARNRAHTKKR
jgi:HK97 family phage prohead protease